MLLLCGPQLQGQSRRQQPVSDPADLRWVGPDQLDYGHVSQVEATLSVLLTHKTQRETEWKCDSTRDHRFMKSFFLAVDSHAGE